MLDCESQTYSRASRCDEAKLSVSVSTHPCIIIMSADAADGDEDMSVMTPFCTHCGCGGCWWWWRGCVAYVDDDNDDDDDDDDVCDETN